MDKNKYVLFWGVGVETGFLCIALGMSWNSLCRPGWPQTHKSACLCLPIAGIKGVCHHAQLGIGESYQCLEFKIKRSGRNQVMGIIIALHKDSPFLPEQSGVQFISRNCFVYLLYKVSFRINYV